jgi:hypothetical protein
MDGRASALVGDWDVYSGPMHSELHLDASGNYVHAYWGARKHWGKWSLQDQNGMVYLVLELADALPRVGAGFPGWQPVSWPNYEAWPVLHSDADTVRLQNGWMHRRVEAPPPVPAFVPPQPIGPLSMPSVPAPSPIATPPPIAFSFPPPPPLPVPSQPPGLPSQSVLEQWTKEHADWNKVREGIAATLQADNDTTRQINEMYAAQRTADWESNQKIIGGMNEATHNSATAFVNWLRTGRY